ncbi:MAG TPA: phytanoyl-CoA dioxygenase family protein [Methylophilaceae bacterium]|jgi:hypothetical protein|nr:phytanoyl-CoA dioxygenase family protein [Methylophilaceae bacterium]
MNIASRYLKEVVVRYIPAIYFFPRDFVAHLIDESHRSHASSFVFLRFVYVHSRGYLRTAFLWFFRLVRPCTLSTGKHKVLVADIRHDGIAALPRFLNPEQVSKIRNYLTEQPGFRIGSGFAKSPAYLKAMASGLKLEYSPTVILKAPGMDKLIEDPTIHEIAADYLGCEPIFTGVAAWWSLPDENASESDLNWSAQKFHFDYDWPAFVKFFIYLTDVGEKNGPFTFIYGTHEKKNEWRNGRLDDEYVYAQYGDAVRPMVGAAGDMLIADTVGYHKGERVKEGARLILQLEFAVSRLGASCQYDLLPKNMKPLNARGHTFDVFAG